MNRLWPMAAGTFALAMAARGQSVLFLRPESYHVARDQAVRVHLESDGKPVAWDDSRVRWLFERGEGTQQNMDAAPGEPVAGRVIIELPAAPDGAVAVGADLKPAVETIEAEQLRAFARACCDEELPETVKGPVRVERVQSCKTLLRSGPGGGGGGSYAAVSEGTQGAEVVTFMDPTRVLVDSDVAIVTSARGGDLEDARVLATRVSSGNVQEIRTREEGAGHIHIDGAGEWRVEFHHLERAKAGSGADWTLVSATLTFEVPAEAPAKGAGR